MEQVVWKPVCGYEDRYEVSNYGDVRSISKGGLILSPARDDHGYFRVCLYFKGAAQYKRVHRLVAEAFLPNASRLPEVNHINGNKTDNKVENLEWISTRENIIHAYKSGLKVQTGETPCMRSDGIVYESYLDAQNKTGISAGNISQACRGKRKTAGGYGWAAI
nr:MAG TPA: homing endonuclease [Caudoviricetes sp.]